MRNKISLLAVAIALGTVSPSHAAEPICPNGSSPDARVIWCDDFEDSVPLSQKYFDYNSVGGTFVPVAAQGFGGGTAMRAIWQAGQDEAGAFARTFGRSPVSSLSNSNQNFREIYWREYVRNGPGWSGNPFKLSRATIFAAPTWAQAMIAHVWGDGQGDALMIDPASGIDASNRLITTSYNDFDHLRWLGGQRAQTAVFGPESANRWYCIETHVKLNAPGAADGVMELFIDGQLEARKAGLNFVGSWQDYGLNSISFENHWNGGAPAQRVRYLDNIVISTGPIGCLSQSAPVQVAPAAPTNLRIVR